LESIRHLLFDTLHRQVATIHSGNGSRLLPLCWLLMFLLTLGRSLAVSICLYYNIAAYFEVDLVSKRIFYQSSLRSQYLPNFFVLFIKFFSARLFSLLYVNVDKVVWSHLYDLVVRNSEQVCLKLWTPKRGNQNWFRV